MAQEFVEKQIPLAQLDHSQIALSQWITEQEKQGYIPLTWRIEGKFAHFFMVKKAETDGTKSVT